MFLALSQNPNPKTKINTIETKTMSKTNTKTGKTISKPIFKTKIPKPVLDLVHTYSKTASASLENKILFAKNFIQ
jgi:hypothetical protein